MAQQRVLYGDSSEGSEFGVERGLVGSGSNLRLARDSRRDTPRPFKFECRRIVSMKKPHNVPRPPHAIQPKPIEAAASVKPKKGSESKDIREDHGTRQMKTASNPRTFPH